MVHVEHLFHFFSFFFSLPLFQFRKLLLHRRFCLLLEHAVTLVAQDDGCNDAALAPFAAEVFLVGVGAQVENALEEGAALLCTSSSVR
jgi:hypothetical protein